MKSKQIEIYNQIREKYPNPKIANDCDLGKGDYCVGGACTLFTGDTSRIPLGYRINEALIKLNPCFDMDSNVGRLIYQTNDKGDFEGAWELVKQALIQNHD